MIHTVAPTCLLLLAAATRAQTCQPSIVDPASFAKIAFDYLIIGGGTAGLTVASKLAENGTFQVGVIEAGTFHFNDPLVDEPANIGLASGNPDYDWAFTSVPQVGLGGTRMPTPRGKMIGGSSGLNFLAWNRGSEADYDAWAQFGPGSNWDWNGLLPHMKGVTATTVNQSNPYPGIPADAIHAGSNPAFVGFQGPINASYNVLYTDPVSPYVKALNNLGVPTNANPDNGTNAGVTNTRSSIDRSRGVRSYAIEYYCRSAGRRNLHVLTDAYANQILLSKGHDDLVTANGVEFTVKSSTFVAKARKEVILSAGAIQTPQLLELSGIGNATLLHSLNISSVVDLPQVGENLQDHLFSGVEYLLKPGVKTFDELRINATFAAEQAAEYNATRTGFLAAVDPTLSFLPFQHYLDADQIKSSLATFDAVTGPLTTTNPSLQGLQHTIQRTWIENGTVPQVELVLFTKGLFAPAADRSYITILMGSLHPLARGSVHINTSVASEPPLIDPKYLTNDFDLSMILDAFKFVLKLGTTAPLSDIIESRSVPAPEIQSDADLVNFIRAVSQTGAHPIGTAPMGPRALGGVVDSNLKVYGTKNLRVVDASVIPLHISAHIQATIYAMAEKAADLIAEQSSSHVNAPR